MRIFRKIITVVALSVLLIVALTAGGLATTLYTTFGSGRSIVAEGPAITADALDSCQVVLIDVEKIEVSRPVQLGILPGPQEKISITVSPQMTFNALILPRASVDSAILGFDTCVASLESGVWTVSHSALGQPWYEIGMDPERVQTTATSISFDVADLLNSTLVISLQDQEAAVKEIVVNGDLSVPNANSWAAGLAIVSGVLLALFIFLVVFYISRGVKRPQT